ncbi:MAG: hypothetical protein R2911_38185 [Caldilineaceae bacterium]
MTLSSQDQKVIAHLAQQHGVSQGAVEALWAAVRAGNGSAAQFNHPELGGMGQWMAGGMTMIGDFSNYRLQAAVADICAALSAHLQTRVAEPVPTQTQVQSRTSPASKSSAKTSASRPSILGAIDKKLFSGSAASPESSEPPNWPNWWPLELGSPSGSGSQNDMHYAYFGGAKRLALRINNRVTIYDTADHQIGGVSQQQDARQTVTFQSQKGDVPVSQLQKVREYTR